MKFFHHSYHSSVFYLYKIYQKFTRKKNANFFFYRQLYLVLSKSKKKRSFRILDIIYVYNSYIILKDCLEAKSIVFLITYS